MIGSKESVLTKLRDKNTNVFSIGRICYIASLCVKDGIKALQFKVDDLLVDIFYFFHHSSKRKQEFKAFQEFTEVDEDRILKHCPTRWLSLEKVVNRTLSHLPALKSYFASHKDVEKTGKVKSIHDKLHDLLISLILNFLAFIVHHINKFNVIFQTEQCMIGDLLPEMDRLLRTFTVKLVQMRCIESCLNLKEVDFKTRENQHQHDKLAVGMNARSLLVDAVANNITSTVEQKFFASVRAFYKANV